MNKKLFYLLLGLNCLACAWILAVRCSSNLNSGTFYPINGWESLMAYSIWKIQNHLPLYEWPQREPFALTLYNYLFYELYAYLLNRLGVSGAGILLAGRMLTLLFACLGAGVLTSIMREACPEQTRKGTMPLAVMLASLTWLSTSYLGWHALTLRPDVAAVATACIGTLILVHGVAKHSLALVALSGLFFYGCWAQKQSAVTLFLGACLCLLISRKFRSLVVLASFFAIPVLVTLWVGGDQYRYNILIAPRIVGSFSLKAAVSEWGKVIMLNLLVWVLAAVSLGKQVRKLVVIWINGLHETDDVSSALTQCVMACTFVVGLPIATLLLSKEGAGKQHLLEVFVAASVLAFSQLAHLRVLGSKQATQLARFAVSVLAFLWLAYPALQMAYLLIFGSASYGRGLATGQFGLNSLAQLKEGKTPWHVQLASNEQLVERKAVASELASLPKPLFIRDEVFLLPWYATGGRYPAYNPDPIYEEAAVRKGIMMHSLQQLLRQHRFASVILQTEDAALKDALTSDYREVPAPPKIRERGFRLLVYNPDTSTANRRNDGKSGRL